MTNEGLVQLYQNGNKEALNELVEFNTGLVYKLANKFYTEKTSSIDIEDLQQEGFIGLVMAAKKYDFNNYKKAKFSTYAVFWIYQKMNRYINQKNTNDETSLNVSLNDSSNKEVIDYIESVDYSFENIEEQIYNKQLRKEMDQVMCEKLTLQQREALKLRYGWDNNKCMTLDEISLILNVGYSKIRHIEFTALKNMRNSNWGRKRSTEYYNERFNNRDFSISEKIKSINFEEKYFSIDRSIING